MVLYNIQHQIKHIMKISSSGNRMDLLDMVIEAICKRKTFRSNLVLTSDIPDSETDVFVLHSFHIETWNNEEIV